MTSKASVDLAYERALLDNLGRIWLTPKDRSKARSALLEIEARVDEAPPVAFKHKVTTIMAANARELSLDDDLTVAAAAARLAEALRHDDEDAHAHRQLLLTEVQRIAQILGDRGCIIKGFCNARFYPSNYDRWMRDIDVFCPSWPDALEFLELLLQDGYKFDLDECSWVKADEPRGREMYGQIFLIRPEGKDFCRVDIHYGTYSIGYAGYLDLPRNGFMSMVKVGQTTVKVLDAQLCPLIAQSHALSDGYVAIKDINDFVALAQSTQLDWQAIGQRLRVNQLHPQAALLARHTISLYDDPAVMAAAMALLSGTGSPRWSLWQTHNRSWGLRATVNSSFAARWRLGRGDGLQSGALDAVRCFLFYIRRLQLSVRHRSLAERAFRFLMAKPDLDTWALRPDACTLLIDADVVTRLANITRDSGTLGASWRDTSEPDIAITHADATTLVRMHHRVFVPTLDLIIPPVDAGAAARA
jgi:Uncharacterised nucleotidyltransferase